MLAFDVRYLVDGLAFASGVLSDRLLLLRCEVVRNVEHVLNFLRIFALKGVDY